MNRLQRIEKSLAEKIRRTDFTIGDTVRVHVKVVEGGKERIQVFEGVVIARSGGANRETFTVRKVSYNTGVERVFPVNSPKIDRIEVVRRSRVRRAKLYFLRERRGKSARLVERDMRGKEAAAAEAAKVSPVEEPKAEAPKAEEPKAPEAEAPKSGAPKAEETENAPKAEADVPADASKAEEAEDAPKAEVDAPAGDAPEDAPVEVPADKG